MARKSSENPAQGASEASYLLGQFLKTTQRIKAETSSHLSVNETDFRALSVLMSKGPMTPGELGKAVGLTSGSTTIMIERLIKVGHVSKSPSIEDGRSSVIEIKPRSHKKAQSLVEPMIHLSDEVLKGMTKSEIDGALKFLRKLDQSAKKILEGLQVDK